MIKVLLAIILVFLIIYMTFILTINCFKLLKFQGGKEILTNRLEGMFSVYLYNYHPTQIIIKSGALSKISINTKYNNTKYFNFKDFYEEARRHKQFKSENEHSILQRNNNINSFNLYSFDLNLSNETKISSLNVFNNENSNSIHKVNIDSSLYYFAVDLYKQDSVDKVFTGSGQISVLEAASHIFLLEELSKQTNNYYLISATENFYKNLNNDDFNITPKINNFNIDKFELNKQLFLNENYMFISKNININKIINKIIKLPMELYIKAEHKLKRNKTYDLYIFTIKIILELLKNNIINTKIKINYFLLSLINNNESKIIKKEKYEEYIIIYCLYNIIENLNINQGFTTEINNKIEFLQKFNIQVYNIGYKIIYEIIYNKNIKLFNTEKFKEEYNKLCNKFNKINSIIVNNLKYINEYIKNKFEEKVLIYTTKIKNKYNNLKLNIVKERNINSNFKEINKDINSLKDELELCKRLLLNSETNEVDSLMYNLNIMTTIYINWYDLDNYNNKLNNMTSIFEELRKKISKLINNTNFLFKDYRFKYNQLKPNTVYNIKYKITNNDTNVTLLNNKLILNYPLSGFKETIKLSSEECKILIPVLELLGEIYKLE